MREAPPLYYPDWKGSKLIFPPQGWGVLTNVLFIASGPASHLEFNTETGSSDSAVELCAILYASREFPPHLSPRFPHFFALLDKLTCGVFFVFFRQGSVGDREHIMSEEAGFFLRLS